MLRMKTASGDENLTTFPKKGPFGNMYKKSLIFYLQLLTSVTLFSKISSDRLPGN